jgi:hypothetical protein
MVDDPAQPDLYLISNPQGKNRRYTSDPRKATGFARAQLATVKAQAVLDKVAQKGKGKGKPGEKFPFNTNFKEIEIIETDQVRETERVILGSGAQKSIRSLSKTDQAFVKEVSNRPLGGEFGDGNSRKKRPQPGNHNLRIVPARSRSIIIINDVV